MKEADGFWYWWVDCVQWRRQWQYGGIVLGEVRWDGTTWTEWDASQIEPVFNQQVMGICEQVTCAGARRQPAQPLPSHAGSYSTHTLTHRVLLNPYPHTQGLTLLIPSHTGSDQQVIGTYEQVTCTGAIRQPTQPLLPSLAGSYSTPTLPSRVLLNPYTHQQGLTQPKPSLAGPDLWYAKFLICYVQLGFWKFIQLYP